MHTERQFEIDSRNRTLARSDETGMYLPRNKKAGPLLTLPFLYPCLSDSGKASASLANTPERTKVSHEERDRR